MKLNVLNNINSHSAALKAPQYIKYNNHEIEDKNDYIIHYFNDFQTFCFDLTLDSVLKGELKFKFN